MPFINAKVSPAMTGEKKEAVKQRLGKAVSLIPGKSEGWLMVGIEDQYELYFKGNQDGPAAFVEVKLFGKASGKAYAEMTAEICRILTEELDIPGERVYVTYQEVENWGWNGNNF